MSYPTVGAGPRNVCEVCGSDVRGQAIRGGCVLEKCQTCGHLLRDLERCPADHRDLAYGGEPTLDRIRLDLTYRELVRDGVPGRVFEVGFGAGSMLRRFLDEVLGPDDDIAYFEYVKRSNRETGPALVGLELGHPRDLLPLLARMETSPLTIERVDPGSPLFRFIG